jgi:hypothetical protein
MMAVLGFIGRVLIGAAIIYVVVYAVCCMAYSTWSGYSYIKRPDKVAAVLTPLLLLSVFLAGYTKLPLIYFIFHCRGSNRRANHRLLVGIHSVARLA